MFVPGNRFQSGLIICGLGLELALEEIGSKDAPLGQALALVRSNRLGCKWSLMKRQNKLERLFLESLSSILAF